MNMETGTIIPGEGESDSDNADIETKARRVGWRSPDELEADGVKIDPSRYKSAEDFYNDALEKLPIARSTIKRLEAKLDKMEREQKRASEFFSKAEERAYARALDDLRAKQEAAVETGDIEAFRAADREADKLRSEMGKPADTQAADDTSQAVFAGWLDDNPWYVMNKNLAEYTDIQAKLVYDQKGGKPLNRSELDNLAAKVKAKFPTAFDDTSDDDTPPKPKRSLVEGATARPTQRGSKTRADLPPEARAMMDKWLKNGTIKSEADYLKHYQW